MVMYNNGLPDPPDNFDKNLSSNEDIFIGEDSTESDEEHSSAGILHGYQPLPLGPEEINENSDNELENNEIERNGNPQEIPQDPNIPSSSTVEAEIVKQVWSGPPQQKADIEMDSNKINEVKQAMLNVTLPPSAIPDWAKTIPEDQWKQHLLNRIQKENN